MRDIGFVVLVFFLSVLWNPSWPGQAIGEAVNAYHATIHSCALGGPDAG